MPNITCQGCICCGRGHAFVALCSELRKQHLCQKQIALRLAGQLQVEIEPVIEGEYEAAAIRARGETSHSTETGE